MMVANVNVVRGKWWERGRRGHNERKRALSLIVSASSLAVRIRLKCLEFTGRAEPMEKTTTSALMLAPDHCSSGVSVMYVIEDLGSEEMKPYYLGDLDVVDALLRGLVSGVVGRYGEVSKGELNSAAAFEADLLACVELGAILAGHSSDYYPANGWTGEPLAAFIRARTGEHADVAPADVLAGAVAHMVLDVYKTLGLGVGEKLMSERINETLGIVTLLMLGVDDG